MPQEESGLQIIEAAEFEPAYVDVDVQGNMIFKLRKWVRGASHVDLMTALHEFQAANTIKRTLRRHLWLRRSKILRTRIGRGGPSPASSPFADLYWLVWVLEQQNTFPKEVIRHITALCRGLSISVGGKNHYII
jgi:hypothetical protein